MRYLAYLLSECLLATVLLCASTAYAGVEYRVRTRPAPTVEGHTTYTFSLVSDVDQPINGVAGDFHGPFHQVNPFGIETVYQDQNAVFDFIPNEVGDDSQWLFQTSDILRIPSASHESDNRLAAAFTNLSSLPAPFNPTSFDLAQLVVPSNRSFTFDLDLDVDGTLVNLSGGVLVKTLSAVSSPSSGSTISLQAAFNRGRGLLDNAVMLSANGEGNLVIGEAFVQNDPHNLFGATIDGLNIDLSLDRQVAKTLPAGPVTAELLVATNGGDLSYLLTVQIPEPMSLPLLLLAILSLAGISGKPKLLHLPFIIRR